jgi:hypothetical protein
MLKNMNLVCLYYEINYHNFGHMLRPVFYLKLRHFGNWILFPSSAGTYLDVPNKRSYSIYPDTSSYTNNVPSEDGDGIRLRNFMYLNKRIVTVIQDIHKRMAWFQKLIKMHSRPTLVEHTLSAAGTVQVSHALPAVGSSCLLRGRGNSFQYGVITGEGSLCAPFWGVQICDYSAAWVSCTV